MTLLVFFSPQGLHQKLDNQLYISITDTVYFGIFLISTKKTI